MKKIGWMILLSLLLIQPVQAAQLPSEVQEILPPDAEELLEELGRDGAGIPSLADGLGRLWNRVCDLLGGIVREEMGSAVGMLGVLLLCALLEDCFQAVGDSSTNGLVVMAGGLCTAMLAVGDLRSMMGLGTQILEELDVFSKALLPTLSAAVAAGGGVAAAGVRHVAAVVFADILLSLVRGTLLPMVYLYVAAVTADLLVPGKRLLTLANAMKKGTTWILTGLLTLYTVYLSLAGIAAGTTDTLSLQLTRSAMGAVPVVGGIISNAAGVVLSGASALKSTIGIVGVLAVFAVCLTPFLRLAVHYFLYKLAAFFAGTFGSQSLVSLVDALGSAFGLVLGMVGACATLLVISVMSCVMVVTT